MNNFLNKEHYAYYKISDYEMCPYRYKRLHIDKISSFSINKWNSFGMSIADVLEELYTKPDQYKDANIETLKMLLDKFWIPKQCKHDFQFSKQLSFQFLGYDDIFEENDAKQRGAFYLVNYIEYEPIVPMFGVEKKFKVPVADFIYTGRIDLVKFNRAKGLEIIDDKTGKMLGDLSNNIQLCMYIYALEYLYDIPVYLAGLHYLKVNKREVLKRNEFNVSKVVGRVVNAVEGIRSGTFPCIKNSNCKYCEVKHECRF